MTKPNARTGTAPFAHLVSLMTGKGAKRAGAEEEREEDVDAEDVDEEDTSAADDKPEEGAEDDKPSEDAESDDGDDKEGKRARRAQRADKDEDDEAESKAEDADDDEDMAKARREGYLAAQARGRRIFGAAAAAARPDMAAHFAFNDDMPSAKAVAMLEMATSGAAPQTGGSRLHRRMSRVVTPAPGTGGASRAGAKSEVDAFVEMAAAAAKKAGI